MPPPCTVETCKRKSRALCHCCDKELCTDHLIEHDDSINSQVHPLVNEINAVADQLSHLNIDSVISNCRRKIDNWRDECYALIDRIYQDKCDELKKRCVEKMTKQQTVIEQIKVKMDNLIREKEATYEDIPQLKLIVNTIKRAVDQFEKQGIVVDTRPLSVNPELIFIERWLTDEIRTSNITQPFRTIECTDNPYPVMAANKQFFLLSCQPMVSLFDKSLTFVRECQWKFDAISDICWSSTLNAFIAITSKNGLFLMKEDLIDVQPIETIEKQPWVSITCSNANLFLSTNQSRPSIYVFSILTSFRLVRKRIFPNDNTSGGETIQHIAYSNKTLALLISRANNETIRVELRSLLALDLLWSCVLPEYNPNTMVSVQRGEHPSNMHVNRFCFLRCGEWLALDHSTPSLLVIGKYGKLKSTLKCELKPYNAVLFDSNTLAIRTPKCVNFYRV